MASVTILIDQRGNSNKIWAQVDAPVKPSANRHAVIHGPIKKDGSGLTESQSSATWIDKQKKGYQLLVTFEGVPRGMERACVAAIAHVKAGFSPRELSAGSTVAGAFAKKCGEKFLTKGNYGGHGFTFDMSKEFDETDVVAKVEPEPEKHKPKHDLSALLKTNRRSGFF